MSEEILKSNGIEKAVLQCANPACPGSHIHVTHGELFTGPDDHHADFMLGCDVQKNMYLKTWPEGKGPRHSNRKRELDIVWRGWCEGCHHQTEYRVLFHKGTTYVESENMGQVDMF